MPPDVAATTQRVTVFGPRILELAHLRGLGGVEIQEI
jgi:hypothetical protein